MYPGGCKGLQHTPRDIIKRLNDLSWHISKEDAQAAGRERTYKRTAISDATLEFWRKRYEVIRTASNGDSAGTSIQSTPHKVLTLLRARHIPQQSVSEALHAIAPLVPVIHQVMFCDEVDELQLLHLKAQRKHTCIVVREPDIRYAFVQLQYGVVPE
jgi:hypothetical protein